MIKMKKTIKTILAIMLTGLIISGLYSFYHYNKIKVSNIYADEFTQELTKVINEQKKFDMTDVTKFDWDKMFVFYPYTSRDEMEKIVGQEWTTYSYFGYYILQKSKVFGQYPLDDDSLNSIVFMKGDQIVMNAIFFRNQVDFTQLLKQTFNREEAQFLVEDKVIKHITYKP